MCITLSYAKGLRNLIPILCIYINYASKCIKEELNINILWVDSESPDKGIYRKNNRKNAKEARFSKKPKTLAISPALATLSGPFFRRALARTMPMKAKGIAKDVKNTLPMPSKKDREKKMLTSPHTRLKVPEFSDRLLIFFPP